MDLKTFICQNFSSLPCAFTVTGEEDCVIQEAEDHVCKEHGYVDTPQLKQEISDSLVDANPTPVDPTDDSSAHI